MILPAASVEDAPKRAKSSCSPPDGKCGCQRNDATTQRRNGGLCPKLPEDLAHQIGSLMARITILPRQTQPFPRICVCCGSPSTLTRDQVFRVDGALSATVLAASMLAGGLAWTEHNVTIALPVCDRHRKQGGKSTKTFVQGTAVAASRGVAAYVISLFGLPAAGFLAVLAAFTFMATLFIAMHEVDDGLKAKIPKTGGLAISGVNPGFAKAFEGSREG